MHVNELVPAQAGVQALGYVGVHSDRLDDWEGFASGLLGMQLADRTRGTRSFRMDDRRQRVLVTAGEQGFFGWEVEDRDRLDVIANRLDSAAVRYEPLGRLAGERFVRDGIRLRDPAGNQVEIVHGAEVTEERFVPGRTVSGFRTGALGLGHAVLTAPDVEPLARFYTELLGFRLSDWIHEPFEAYFFHLNPRHHSLALVNRSR